MSDIKNSQKFGGLYFAIQNNQLLVRAESAVPIEANNYLAGIRVEFLNQVVDPDFTESKVTGIDTFITHIYDLRNWLQYFKNEDEENLFLLYQQIINVELHFSDLNVYTFRQALKRIRPITDPNVFLSALRFDSQYYQDPKNPRIFKYGVEVSSDNQSKPLQDQNVLYYEGKGGRERYLIYNQSRTLLYAASDALLGTEVPANIAYFEAERGDQVITLRGSIGLDDLSVAHDPIKPQENLIGSKIGFGTVSAHIYLFDPLVADDLKPDLKVCLDPAASNYYKVSPFQSCDEEFTFADAAAAEAGFTTHNLIAGKCCTYADSTASSFSGGSRITNLPSRDDPDGGEILYTWEGGTSPYDLVFTCGHNDATCAGFTVNNTTDLQRKVTGLSGSDNVASAYGLAVTDAVGATILINQTNLPSVITQADLRCDVSTAINYQSGGTGFLKVCRWCDNKSGNMIDSLTHAGTIPNKVFAVTLDGVSFEGATYNQPSGIFGLQVNSQSNFLAPSNFAGGITGTNGALSLKIFINDIEIPEHQYTFDLGNSSVSPDIDGSGGEYKVERKTLYTDGATWQTFSNQGVSFASGTNVWAIGYNEATPSTHTFLDNTASELSGGLLSNLGIGKYLYKISYSDSNTVHNLEDCHIFLTAEVRGVGCTDPNATNYIGAQYVNSGLIFDPESYQSCTYPDIQDADIQEIADNLFTTMIAYQNLDGMDPCVFEGYPHFTLNAGLSPNNPLAVGGFIGTAYAGINNNIMQIHLLNEIAYQYYGLEGVPAGLVVSSADYQAEVVTIDQNNQQQITEITANATTQGTNGTVDNFTIDGTQTYNFEELVSFGTTPESIYIQVGFQSARIKFIFEYNGDVIGQATIDFLPNGPEVFSVNEVLEAGSLQDILTGETLCQECEGLEDLLVPGCTDPAACNYNPSAQTDDGSCHGYVNGSPQIDSNGQWYAPEAGEWGSPCGCINSNYQEYSVVAAEFAADWNNNIEALPWGSIASACVTPHTSGCTDPDYTEYNPLATTDDGSCQTLVILGCTDNQACNYNSDANTDNETCVYEVADGECDDFENWQFTQIVPPVTCVGTDTFSGTIVISNSTYSGPVSFAITGTGNTFAASPGTEGNDFLQLSGVNPNTLVSTLINPGSFITDLGVANGVTVLAVQTQSGTTFTLDNINAGTFSFHIFPGIVNSLDNEYTQNLCFCNAGNIGKSQLTASEISYITVSASDSPTSPTTLSLTAQFGGGERMANGRRDPAGRSGSCGCCDPASATYDSSINPSSGTSFCNQALCVDYGCMDPEANNYDPNAGLPCTDPNEQNGAGGIPCSPCKYGYIESLYTPAFCMPSRTEQQLDIIRRCIGTAGTTAYVNVLTGKSDCTTKDAWKLILIEYLMSKKGLDCVYNCADESTPALDALKSCSQKADEKEIIGDLSYGIPAIGGVSRKYYIGDTYKFRYSEDDTIGAYYTLTYLPTTLSLSYITSSYIKIYAPSNGSYVGVPNDELPYFTYAPNNYSGWKLCEEPPKKSTNKNYIGKFINFVQNYCRQCQLPVGPRDAEATSETESVITVNGIIITVNNSNIR